ncbi:hypothetical protein CSPAE12_01137, partial [Colletotrichum incanum]
LTPAFTTNDKQEEADTDNTFYAGRANICFSNRERILLSGTIIIPTPFRPINFYVVLYKAGHNVKIARAAAVRKASKDLYKHFVTRHLRLAYKSASSPYYKDPDIITSVNAPPNEDANTDKNTGNDHAKDAIVVTTSPRSPIAVTTAPPACRPYGRLRKTLLLNALLQETNVPDCLSPNYSSAFVSAKEESNKALTAEPFKLSIKAKINALVGRRVFKFVTFNPAAHIGRIFKSRIINKVKGKNTDKPYEKSRLII